jgi:hypothetical protein
LAREKLITYFNKIVMDPDNSLYCVATALHPRFRLALFKDHWKKYPAWHKKADNSIRNVFRSYVDGDMEPEEPSIEHPTFRRVPGAYKGDDRRALTMSVDPMLLTGNRNHKRYKRITQLDEYFDDLQKDLINPDERHKQLMDDLHRWWVNIGQKRYPTLYKMAMDHLSVPCTSCDCERAFSTAKRTITCDRNSLSGTTIEALQLQKNWLRRKAVKSHLTLLQEYIKKKEKNQQ